MSPSGEGDPWRDVRRSALPAGIATVVEKLTERVLGAPGSLVLGAMEAS
eukprot:CAMPEP_0172026362 /NCGR_PEP_ID=MMETSP1041-20130122/16400_1 /TAXON_ID=464988 /ORGANISM="Hemiselmis andersenii, Strain CCMP439" /LENGTH=48 /DNA_ID= /DNA_START= /DNA_END= /DNA_ORIENTATION=